MDYFLRMLPRENIPFIAEQFVWGKILQDGKDVSGYKIVAKSPTLTEKDCNEVLSRTGAGVSQAIIKGRRAFAFFYLPPQQVVFSCTQRSPIPEHHSRYYLQSRFFICKQEVFEAIQADLPFLARQMDEIPVYTQLENLDPFQATFQPKGVAESEMRRIARQYSADFLVTTYRALKGPNPVAIFDSTYQENNILELFQLLYLLTPSHERQNLTFASMASGAEVGKYKFKVNPTGVLKQPHIVIRLDDKKVVPPQLVAQLPSLGLNLFRMKIDELTAGVVQKSPE